MTGKDSIQFSEDRQPSGYARPAIEATLPKQSLLLLWDKKREKGGQPLAILPLRRRGKKPVFETGKKK